MNYEQINFILLIIITVLEFAAIGWLIYEMRKSHDERDEILRLEQRQIKMEETVLEKLDELIKKNN
ncbi:MAG: hypothetical protein CMP58_04820 [Flavobacteriales bacterium]|nr:hypothetical protein [Flavobacteriales bacterium]|tara:strand:+ start:236 stop:433 length:198 start_codon:yes stop_codon:yes gene_type:complete